MAYFLAGCAVLILLLLLGRLLAAADPRSLAAVVRKTGGVLALAAAGFLTIRGALPIAIPLGVFGLALLGRGPGLGLGGPFGSARKTPGQKSHVKTERLEMELDHDSGHMDGRCLSGAFAGRILSNLTDREAMAFLDELREAGAAELPLMEAYLDWRLPGWRDREAGADGAGQTRTGRGETRGGRAGSSRMSREEAFAVLGLASNATEEEIRKAHRKLMMKLHPDQGGSTYLAARINEAKDILLSSR